MVSNGCGGQDTQIEVDVAFADQVIIYLPIYLSIHPSIYLSRPPNR